MNQSENIRVPKGWGYELIFANTADYCGKLLHFESGEKTSMHFHVNKSETFHILTGDYVIRTIDTTNGQISETQISVNDNVNIPKFCPHQIESIHGGDIIEVSTHDEQSDSYRVMGGSSQTSQYQNKKHTTPKPQIMEQPEEHEMTQQSMEALRYV